MSVYKPQYVILGFYREARAYADKLGLASVDWLNPHNEQQLLSCEPHELAQVVKVPGWEFPKGLYDLAVKRVNELRARQ